MIKLIYRFLNQIFDPFKLVRSIPGYVWYLNDLLKYKKISDHEDIRAINLSPYLHNKGKHEFDPHYFYQSAWAFNKIVSSNINLHVDVGSQLNFVGLIASIVKVKFIDIRTAKIKLDNLEILAGNILELPLKTHSVKSLSSLHVAEHIGLGRYGDPIDPNGTRKAICELSRILSHGGELLFSLPIGKPCVCFNAHRIHNPEDIIEWFSKEGLSLKSFDAVGDDKNFYQYAKPDDYKNEDYACGLFCFTRKEY